MALRDPIILAFFPDEQSGLRAITALRKLRYYDASLVRRRETGDYSVKRRLSPTTRTALLVALLIGALTSAIYPYLDVPVAENPWLFRGVPLLAAVAIIAIVFLGRHAYVTQSTIAKYQQWIVADESLVLVRMVPADAGDVFEMLRAEGGQPASFTPRERKPIYSRSLLPRGRFSAEHMRRHAQELAARHRTLSNRRDSRPMLRRVQATGETLDAIILDLSYAAERGQTASQSTEWLLDNSYVIRQHIGDISRNLSRELSRALPVLEVGSFAGEARIYALATEFVCVCDADLDPDEIVDFLRTYQEHQPLSIAELWAMPLMLRIALLETLEDRALEVERRQLEHERADFWISRLLSSVRQAPEHVLITLAEIAREEPNPSPYLVDRLVSELEGESAALGPVRSWLEHKLGAPIAEVIQSDQRRHAADQLTLSSAVKALRRLTFLDWNTVFERVCAVDQVFRDDPQAMYRELDFATRDSYRHAVEEIAARSQLSEVAVAQTVSVLSKKEPPGDRRAHLGYFLIDDGRVDLESQVGFRSPASLHLRRWMKRRPTVLLLGSIGLTSLVMVAALFAIGLTNVPENRERLMLLVMAVPVVILASELATQLVIHILTLFLPARPLPKLELDDGIPDEYRTLVVVPELLTTTEAIQDASRFLEVRFTGNQDPNLHFAILADFLDAPEQVMPGDEALLATARNGITDLNQRYPLAHFSLFFRMRRWSDTEQVWMGWERKRGKLEELNRLLINSAHDDVRSEVDAQTRSYGIEHVGDDTWRSGIRFVITLDSDTDLPPGAARRLIGTLAHPLNQPELAENGESVTRGFGIIQPRVTPSLPSSRASRFARIFAESAGIDPYTRVVSNIYQDLAGEASYNGKGIYDVRTLHSVLNERFPDGSILSHDLLEGSYSRVGLATDIELFDVFPRSYLGSIRREHRWIRGDWQIAAWCSPWVPTRRGWKPNPLDPLHRWKIFDNLRRSLLPVSAFAILVAGWVLFSEAAWLWSAFVALYLIEPALMQLVTWIITNPNQALELRRGCRGWREHSPAWLRVLINAALLPHQATVILDAIVRVGFRRIISHQRLLEWSTSEMVLKTGGRHQSRLVWRLGFIAVLAAVALVIIADTNSGALWAVAPFLLLWVLAPGIVIILDSPTTEAIVQPLSPREQTMLRRLARQTWRFFDDFVGPQSNWLPPDNYQVAYGVQLAHRTSPTNIGLWLLSTLSAHDLGFLTLDDVIDRNVKTLETLQKLERFNGHILNWYDTETLTPLQPRYVSTVDSGNLLASLWTVAQGYEALLDHPVLGTECLQGTAQTLALLKESLLEGQVRNEQSARIDALVATLEELLIVDGNPGLVDIVQRFRSATTPARDLEAAIELSESYHATISGDPVAASSDMISPPTTGPDALYWSRKLNRAIHGYTGVIDRYLPWVESVEESSERGTGSMNREAIARRKEILTTAPSIRALVNGTWARVPTPNAPHRVTGDSPHTDQIETFVSEHLVQEVQTAAKSLRDRAERLVGSCNALAEAMSMRFLYDEERRLFSVGFDVEARRLDDSDYDLLASEARIASFVAVARGDVPIEHWHALGRIYGAVRGGSALLSWSGTMFEYLMPLLVMRRFPNSLLDDACKRAVNAQIDFSAQQGLPWGISEAAFSALDAHRVYQYRAFGVPALGVKRGLEDDLVVAPYASALSLPIAPHESVRNLQRLENIGLNGSYGLYESIDYTQRRTAGGPEGVVAYTYMAHHEGMTLVSIGNALHDGVMQRRFHADVRVLASESLLFERIPIMPVLVERQASRLPVRRPSLLPASKTKYEVTTPDTPTPRSQLLGSREYSTMVTAAGGGYSRWGDIEITRWYADTTLDSWGSFCYVRDIDQDIAWSIAHQPVQREADEYNVTFSADHVEYERRDAGISTVTEIAVSLEDAAEVRRTTFINYSGQTRHLELTSFSELVLATHAADHAHPAFSKLFVQTESISDHNALIAWRNAASHHVEDVWATHVLAIPPGSEGTFSPIEFETDRARFIGRGHDARNPEALRGNLSNTTGWVLDPIFSLRTTITLEPGQRIYLVFTTAAAGTRNAILDLAEKYADVHAANRVFDLAEGRAQLESSQLRISGDDIQRFQQLASHMLFPNARMRSAGSQLRLNRLGQSRLWPYGISGDLPILVATIGQAHDLKIIREVIAAHTYWRLHGFETDLMILNEEEAGYDQPLADQVRKLIGIYGQYTTNDYGGKVFLESRNRLPIDELNLFLSAARVVLLGARGSLVSQLAIPIEKPQAPIALPTKTPREEDYPVPLPTVELECLNGLGGFAQDGAEYVITLAPGERTPAPWVNVFANPRFGALVSETTSGFCWSENSQSNRLLPWSDDPVSDPAGDVVYIRDDETGTMWPVAQSNGTERRIRHGQGYSTFEQHSHGLKQDLTYFVPVDETGGSPVRIQQLRLGNAGASRRTLSVFAYVEWVLGVEREATQMHIVTDFDAESGAMFARNAYHPSSSNRTAFFCSVPRATSFTGDRTEFLGRNGTSQHPAALGNTSLSNRAGAGFDPCGALQVTVEIPAGEEIEIVFLFGQTDGVDQARHLIHSFRVPNQATDSLLATRNWWNRLVETIQVETPDEATNFLLNRWLLYQTLSCRIWGRSAFYQSGGAIGFRDQLQDVLAVVYSAPQISRQQILTAARRQFSEGDVQHWWHAENGAGIRSRISDDLLWLPFVTAHYVTVTGDTGVLDEVLPYLEGAELEPQESERYFIPAISIESGTLLDHCQRAIARGLTSGPHGLPLIGTGDWNDGMNLVGIQGKGESVWLAWFLIDVLNRFGRVVETRGLHGQAIQYREHAMRLAASVEERAWDGSWYRRAYFDDGTPIGSKSNEENRIDSIAQSWGVLSGAARADRATTALQAVEEHLLLRDDQMLLLFTPPFEHSSVDPGYLKRYPPGVRENGGQYTHAAIWVAQAYARQGDGDRATEILHMLNPIEHTRTPKDAERYRAEPYAVAADVYALEGHVGRAGWSWYTGSSGWLYRVWIEEIIGLHLTGETLRIEPCIPRSWPGCVVHFRYKSAQYRISIENPDAVCRGVGSVEVDGIQIVDGEIRLRDDAATHAVTVRLASLKNGRTAAD